MALRCQALCDVSSARGCGCDADVPGQPLFSRHLPPRIWRKDNLELKLLGLGFEVLVLPPRIWRKDNLELKLLGLGFEVLVLPPRIWRKDNLELKLLGLGFEVFGFAATNLAKRQSGA